MLIAMTGSGGFVGQALARRLARRGHTVVPISREPGLLPRVDAVVHLAGEPIGGRWTARRRRAILESRIDLTRRLVDRMRDSGDPPRVFLSASGTGIYGDRPGETLTEESAPGCGFRTDVCLAWEAEAARARCLGIRTALLRFGAILHPSGGILARLLPWHRRGLSFILGGRQDPFPWIGLSDAVSLAQFCLEEPVAGPV
ncbi:MAG TPA: NAD-dependent epimerase/dehydratase family protein, partial [Planctomycetota bacterium]|nr:NAD-dependent epimerase/dehydratase family protein [Planctomycetota bacterium]